MKPLLFKQYDVSVSFKGKVRHHFSDGPIWGLSSPEIQQRVHDAIALYAQNNQSKQNDYEIKFLEIRPAQVPKNNFGSHIQVDGQDAYFLEAIGSSKTRVLYALPNSAAWFDSNGKTVVWMGRIDG